ncbi:MAG: membrane protein insertase YidC [Pseudomonadota bacterium]
MQQNQPSPEEQRNLILAAVLSFLVLMLWQIFFVNPDIERQRQAQEQARIAAEEQGALPGAAGTPGGLAGQPLSREAALGRTQRIEIETPRLSGSISLYGGRVDELLLKDYRVSLDPGAKDVELLWPTGTEQAYYAVFGWSPVDGVFATPTPSTEWVRESGETLAPGSPVTLVWDNGDGLVFRRTFAVDEDYLFTVTQNVENRTGGPVTLFPYGILARHGTPRTEGFFVLHEGAVGVLNGSLEERDYGDLVDLPLLPQNQGRGEVIESAPGGWIGFTDKYWMTALIPGQGEAFTALFKTQIDSRGEPIYRAETALAAKTVAAGASLSVPTRLFAGAKEISAIRGYEYQFDGLERPTSFFGKLSDFFFHSSTSRFTDAIDWGWFFFLTKPIFELLLFFYNVFGNMGVAIIVLTIMFKTVLFPLAYKSYVSMSKLKKLQPEMKKLQERYGDDKMGMQKEMMELYKKERVNPAAGCLPILLQIPIFFSLYKVIFIALEIRHAPFFGWIQDLSAPDPTSILNLFGLLPWDTPGPQSFFFIFSIGIWPILMGITMWFQQMLNPAPADPVQEKIFNLLPLIFMFMLGTFASGLVIYWTANNVLTIAQQYAIMRSQGVDVNFVQNIRRQFGLEPKEGPS